MKSKMNIFYTSPHILASLSKSSPVLLAYSGGADSSALLHLLNDDAKANGFKLYAAHFNHGIRGEEANRDAEFCKNTCDNLGIPFYLGSADIPSLAKATGNSIEAEAREQRYAFFEAIMRENDIPILVTAHHAEDQVESILLHILRGSGISGLCGIADCRSFGNEFFLIRPILKTEKQNILNYCKNNNIEFVTDSTNLDTDYARNFIRSELTPKMRAIQPNLTKVFERLSENASDTNDFIDSTAKSIMENEFENGIVLSKFNELHKAIKVRVIILAFAEHSSGLSLESTHIQSIIALCQKGEPHSSISLPNTLAAKIENGCLVFAADKDETESQAFDVPFTVGKTALPNGAIINIEKNPLQNPSESDVFLNIKCDMIKNNTHFRSKLEGDTIFQGKMNKKVKKLISEKKIPLDMRKKLPLLVCENEILWIPTVAVCDTVKKDKIDNGMDFYRITIIFEN